MTNKEEFELFRTLLEEVGIKLVKRESDKVTGEQLPKALNPKNSGHKETSSLSANNYIHPKKEETGGKTLKEKNYVITFRNSSHPSMNISQQMYLSLFKNINTEDLISGEDDGEFLTVKRSEILHISKI